MSIVSNHGSFGRQTSFVVQGPIFGRASDGPDARFTQRGLASIRQFYPEAEIILSTWQEYDTPEFLDGLTFDRAVFSVDPGSYLRDDTTRSWHNGNRLIVSTAAGLQVASRHYAVKLRSDIRFLHGRLGSLVGFYDQFDSAHRILRERVLVSQTTTINPRRLVPLPFHVCDWFYCGLAEDLRNIFDIPLMPEPAWSRWYEHYPKPDNDPYPTVLCRFLVEDYIWSSFLRKHRAIRHDWYCQIDEEIVTCSEQLIANNVVMATNRQLGIEAQKYPGIRAPHLLKCYTWNEWRELYAKYGGGPAVVGWDRELAINFSAHWLHKAVLPILPLGRPLLRRWRNLRRRMSQGGYVS